METLTQYIPLDALKIFLTLILSFLIGFEREERYSSEKPRYFFGGARIFPLIGILGYIIAKVSEANVILIATGFIGISGFMYLSYREKIKSGEGSMTSEISALVTYFIGILVYQEAYWIAMALVVISTLLLDLKHVLENLAKKIPEEEITTFTKFLFLAAVILPIVPNKEMTPFKINPFTTWLIVVVISALSYGAYVLKKLLGSRGGTMAMAALGGAYSSTLTSVLLAKQSRLNDRSRLLSGAILLASSIMYLRLVVLIAFFNLELLNKLIWGLVLFGVVGLISTFIWIRNEQETTNSALDEGKSKNPLEVTSAIFLAVMFVAITVIIHLVKNYWGESGIYGVSFLAGLVDVDPLVMSLVQGGDLDTTIAAKGILIAIASNNLLKAGYVFFLSRGGTRRQGSLFLLLLAVATFLYFAAI
ncbi:MAG TPA: MgtC/SapB family protein [Bdellovibrio sp.]|nr:MgtC/SapB family protein [Bdellovibrio sp.]